MSIFKKLWVRLGCTILISEEELNMEDCCDIRAIVYSAATEGRLFADGEVYVPKEQQDPDVRRILANAEGCMDAMLLMGGKTEADLDAPSVEQDFLIAEAVAKATNVQLTLGRIMAANGRSTFSFCGPAEKKLVVSIISRVIGHLDDETRLDYTLSATFKAVETCANHLAALEYLNSKDDSQLFASMGRILEAQDRGEDTAAVLNEMCGLKSDLDLSPCIE